MSKPDPEVRRESPDVRRQVWGARAEAIEQGLKDIDPDLAALITDVVYDDVFAREGLELKTKELLAVAHLISVGSEAELKTHMYGALYCGSSLRELKETILHAAMFVGFPRALAAMKVLKELKVK